MRRIKMSERDLDAFRKGIEAQVRDDVMRENSDRITKDIFNREYVYDVLVVRADELELEDTLLACLNGQTFWRDARVAIIDWHPQEPLPTGYDFRIGYVSLTGRGSGLRAVKRDEQFLIEYRVVD